MIHTHTYTYGYVHCICKYIIIHSRSGEQWKSITRGITTVSCAVLANVCHPYIYFSVNDHKDIQKFQFSNGQTNQCICPNAIKRNICHLTYRARTSQYRRHSPHSTHITIQCIIRNSIFVNFYYVYSYTILSPLSSDPLCFQDSEWGCIIHRL